MTRPRCSVLSLLSRIVGVVLLTLLSAETVFAQQPQQLPIPQREKIVGIEILGNRSVSDNKILGMLQTRIGREMDPNVIERDKRVLNRSGLFIDVRPRRKQAVGGVIVIFEVIERPILRHVKYLGNYEIVDGKLAGETGLKVGNPLSPHEINEGRRKIEKYYREKGYNDVQVSILEGNKSTDAGAVYKIYEGISQKILWTKFIGNTIVSDGILNTKIQSKHGFLWAFSGTVDQKKIEEDIVRITAFYRSLGYFQAKVSRRLQYGKSRKWLTLTYIISEGPRFKIRNVRFEGEQKVNLTDAKKLLKMNAGVFFNQKKLAKDVALIKDEYGAKGYIARKVTPETRFLEEPGELDLVYKIVEGNRFRVRNILVVIEGENPHTQENVVRDRISLRPGDIVDMRELRKSEDRLRRSGLFLTDPARGISPRITWVLPDKNSAFARNKNNRSGRSNFRGQSPDYGDDIVVDLIINRRKNQQINRNNLPTNNRQGQRPTIRSRGW